MDAAKTQLLIQVNDIINKAREKDRETKPFGPTAKGKVAEYLNTTLAACLYAPITEEEKAESSEHFLRLWNEVVKLGNDISIEEKLGLNTNNGILQSYVNGTRFSCWDRLDEIDDVIRSFTRVQILLGDANPPTNVLISYYLRAMNQVDALFFNQFSYHSKKEK